MLHKMLTLLLMSLVLVVNADNGPKSVNTINDTHEELLQDQLQFSVKLLKTAAESIPSGQNVFMSPSSVHDALLLTYFSAGGNTSDTLKNLLQIPADMDKQDVIDDYIMWRNYTILQTPLPDRYQLTRANRMYVANQYKVRELMKIMFPRELQETDFAGDPESALIQINGWVAAKTWDMIPDLLPEHSVTNDTILVIVNAAYFKGYWLSRFNESMESTGDFKLADGNTVEATFMKQRANVSRMFDDELESDVLELPYYGDEITMFIILPTRTSSTTIPELLTTLSAQNLLDAFERVNTTMEYDVEVVIPKFKAEQELNLIEIFTLMGAGSVFNRPANFSDLFVDVENIAISLAVHKAALQVDEDGAEVGGSSSMLMSSSSSFIADHPFIYSIYNKNSRILLFTGIFNTPLQEVK